MYRNMSKNYYLIQRNNSNNWYYRFKYEKTYHSTHITDYNKAVQFVESIMTGKTNDTAIPLLGDFAKDFFVFSSKPTIYPLSKSVSTKD